MLEVAGIKGGPGFEKLADHYPLPIDDRLLPGKAILSGRALQLVPILGNPEAPPKTQELAREFGYDALISVPLIREGTVIGVINTAHRDPVAFTDKQIALIRSFADQAVIAIENTRLLTELRQRTEDLTEALEQQTATSEVLQVISSSPGDLEPVFASMLQNAVRICDATFGIIYRWDGVFLHMLSAYNTPPVLAEARRRAPQRPVRENQLMSRMFETKAAVQVADAAATPGYLDRSDIAAVAAVELGGVRTCLGVPMLKENALIGSFTVYRQEVRPFTEKQIALVRISLIRRSSPSRTRAVRGELRQRTDDLTESLEQQTATSEVLQVISSSPGELEPVFETMLENAVRISGAQFGNLFLREGDFFHVGATTRNAPSAYVDYLRRERALGADPRVGLGRLLRTKQSYHVADLTVEPTHDDELRVATIELASARTLIGVPMLKESEVIGAIAIYRQEVRPFTDKQIELVQNFAAQAVIAIENARLLNELRQRTDELGRSVEELRALGEVSQAVNSTLDLETVLSTIVAKAVQLSGTEAGAIYVFDELQREFHLRATYGMDQELIDALTDQHIRLDEPIVAQVMAQPEPIQVADLREASHRPSTRSPCAPAFAHSWWRRCVAAMT